VACVWSVCTRAHTHTADNSSRGFKIHTVLDLNFRLPSPDFVCVCGVRTGKGFFGQASHFGYFSFDPSRLVQWVPIKGIRVRQFGGILFAYFFAALQLLFLFADGSDCS
jgi:hypothetical protein